MCQKLTTAKWGKAGDEDHENGDNTETSSDCDGSVDRQESILHLAASLGLSRLVCSLLHWAAEHPGKQIGMEVDALALDKKGFTPLVRFSPCLITLLYIVDNNGSNKKSYQKLNISSLDQRKYKIIFTLRKNSCFILNE